MPGASPAQLAFPFADSTSATPVLRAPVGRAAPPSWRSRLTVGSRSVIVTLSRARDVARVALEAQQDGPGAWSIGLELRLRPVLSATIRSDSPERLHWAMSRRAPCADGREFFAYALGWASAKLAGETRSRARIHGVRRDVRPVLLEAASGLVDALPSTITAAASRFAPPTRTRVASALARDRGGWLRDAARAHPGLVLFGIALFEAEESEEAGLKLLHDLGHGRRLGPALDAAVAAWSAALPLWAAQPDLWNPAVRRAFDAAATLGPGARAGALAAQKVLCRRAGPRCDPASLLLPPPMRFAPEDVPASPSANGAWFTVMKIPGLTVRPTRRPASAFDEAFAAFASRHAVALATVPRRISLETWIGELRDLLRASGRTPARTTDPARLIAQVDVRELRARRPAVVAPEVPLVPRGTQRAAPRVAQPVQPASVMLSAAAFEPWNSTEVKVEQIATLHDLRAEGMRMRSCVADYREKIERGEIVVFSASIGGRALTIAIAPWMNGWRVSEWKGFANRAVTEAEIARLRPWMTATGIEYRPKT